MKKNSNKEFETTTLSAEVAISKTETGMDYVQVMPDNPRVGLFKPFCGWGRGQLLSNCPLPQPLNGCTSPTRGLSGIT